MKLLFAAEIPQRLSELCARCRRKRRRQQANKLLPHSRRGQNKTEERPGWGGGRALKQGPRQITELIALAVLSSLSPSSLPTSVLSIISSNFSLLPSPYAFSVCVRERDLHELSGHLWRLAKVGLLHDSLACIRQTTTMYLR